MIIDIEVVEKRSNNYLPLLFLLLSGFLFTLKNILYNIGLIKMKSIAFKDEKVFFNHTYQNLFDINNVNYSNNKNDIFIPFLYDNDPFLFGTNDIDYTITMSPV